MKCLEVRRLLTANPQHRDDALLMHLHDCKTCAAYSQQLRQEDRQLERALQLDVPEGLADRILLNQSTAMQTRHRHRLGLAIAATVVLSVGVIIGLLRTGMEHSLQDAVIAHVKAEPDHLSSQQHASLSNLNGLMNKYGAELSGSVGTINYAGTCKIRHSKGIHLVIEAEGKPVTVLYMPDEALPHRETIVDQEFQGVILPSEKGSIAILGQDDNSVREATRRFESALHYF